MATLSIRPRRSKTNPYPRAQAPLARWRKGEVHLALRADGSVVRRIGSGTWTVITLAGQAKKGLALAEVEALLRPTGYVREGA